VIRADRQDLPARGRLRITARTRARLQPYLFVAPAALLIAAVVFVPAAYAIALSFTDATLLRLGEAQFVGLRNYGRALEDETYLIAVPQTVRWVATVALAQLALALPVALFLNTRFRGRALVRTALLMPWVVPSAVTAIAFVLLFHPSLGMVNDILLRLRLIPAFVAWLSDPAGAFGVIALAAVWAGFPFMAVVLLAALQAIPGELYEAALVDGAGVWQRFQYVTLPQLTPTILLIMLLRTIWLAQHVDLIYIMTGGGPGYSNYTISVYVLILLADGLKLGSSSAVAITLAIVLIALSAVYIRYIERTREHLR
jgi:multiple sugar transport system permease protein